MRLAMTADIPVKLTSGYTDVTHPSENGDITSA